MLVSEICRSRQGLTKMLSRNEKVPKKVKKGKKGKAGEGEEEEEEEESGSDSSDDEGAFHHLGPYDASKREPSYAASSTPSLWEASLLSNHFHPSIKLFADSLLKKPHRIKFAGDPTTDFTLNAFLNRFAFKNPKKSVKDNIRRALPTEENPLNTSEFIDSAAADVDPDKMFFHKFFGQRKQLRAG